MINFLLWSAVAQGAVLFSAVTRVTKARWSGPLNGLSEAFAGFFPLSLVLFLLLLAGRTHVFPWLHQDLHGKEAWLNLPFLFARDGLGLLLLYACGWAVVRCDLQLRLAGGPPATGLRRLVTGPRAGDPGGGRARPHAAGALVRPVLLSLRARPQPDRLRPRDGDGPALVVDPLRGLPLREGLLRRAWRG